MRTALEANDDTAMIEVLQIARSEMPEAIKTMQRALEHVVDDGRIEADESSLTLASPSSPEDHFEGARVQQPSADSGSDSSGDTLDCEFIETGIDALRRLSTGADLELPSWTITQYEVDLEAKIGIGFFSEVYRGNWQQYTVAIKVLAETTPRKIFVHEVEIWKKLCHPNVIELLGASSGTGDPPWFLVGALLLWDQNRGLSIRPDLTLRQQVSKYYSRGSLVKYLKGLSGAEYARVDTLKTIHEISNGMAYLHKEGVLHGDLKVQQLS
jgi:abelson tyrosine-protein kinase 1/abelson tyrosine-protein kinase 2